MDCRMCREVPATAIVTYGLYEAYSRGQEHERLQLCSVCLKELWNGGERCRYGIKGLVTTGLMHFEVERLNVVSKDTAREE
jgi:hypothetical protein